MSKMSKAAFAVVLLLSVPLASALVESLAWPQYNACMNANWTGCHSFTEDCTWPIQDAPPCAWHYCQAKLKVAQGKVKKCFDLADGCHFGSKRDCKRCEHACRQVFDRATDTNKPSSVFALLRFCKEQYRAHNQKRKRLVSPSPSPTPSPVAEEVHDEVRVPHMDKLRDVHRIY